MKDFVRVRHHVFPQGTLHELTSNGKWVRVKWFGEKRRNHET